MGNCAYTVQVFVAERRFVMMYQLLQHHRLRIIYGLQAEHTLEDWKLDQFKRFRIKEGITRMIPIKCRSWGSEFWTLRRLPNRLSQSKQVTGEIFYTITSIP